MAVKSFLGEAGKCTSEIVIILEFLNMQGKSKGWYEMYVVISKNT